MTTQAPVTRARLLRGPALSLTSQAAGAVQLVLILVRVGSNRSTDAYFYLWSLGMLPTQILCVGVMYPLLLNRERIARTGLRRIRLVTPALAVLLVAGGAVWLAVNGRLGGALVPLAAASAANAIVQAGLWFRAVAAEAGGDPRWISGVAIPANLAALVALALPWWSDAAAMTAMVCALLVANAGLSVVMRRHRVGGQVLAAAPAVGAGRSGGRWFFTRAAVGYTGLVLMQSTAVLLPASTLTVLGVATRLVGSTSASFTNAVMPNLVHQRSDSPRAAASFLRWLLTVLTGVSALGVLVVWLADPDLLTPAVIVGLWLLTSSASAAAQRMSFRFLAPNAARLTLGGAVVVVACTLASSASTGYDRNVLLSAYAVLDGVSAALLLLALRQRVLGAAVTVLVGALGVLWVANLVG